jgi:hypothetical protein
MAVTFIKQKSNGMTDRGGKRDGAGRPAGSPNRATVDQKMRLCELARQHAATAIDALAEIAESGQAESARIAAACAILDRGYGKPNEARYVPYTPAGEDVDPFDFVRL